MKHLDINQIRAQLHIECKKLNLPQYEIRDLAPETLKDVVSTFKNTGKLVIWSGASENTIWGDSHSNYLFRAWHDYIHILTLGEFNSQGEKLVALKQMSQVGTIFARFIEIEVIEQLNHFEKNGAFPTNQLEFFKKLYK